MELRHLRVFLSLSEELHFGRTAARLHVAQSAISQTLRDLEEELGAQLLERTSRQVKLTSTGQVFLSYAREAVAAVERGTKAARAAHSRGGQLRIRLLAAATVPRIPLLLKRFQTANPGAVLEVRDGTSARNLEALEGAFCDVAFVSLATLRRLGAAYAYAVVETSGLSVVVPARHRLAKLRIAELKELRGERILSLQRDEEPDVRQRLDKRLASLGTVQTAIELSQPHSLVQLVAAGLGVAILPAFAARESGYKVRVVPLAGSAQGGVAAAWNKQLASEPARQFIALVTAEGAA